MPTPNPKPLYPTVCINDSHLEHLITKWYTYMVYGESPVMLLIETNEHGLEWMRRDRFNPKALTIGVRPEREA